MASTAAPGDLEIVRNFVNTVEIDEAVDPLFAHDSLAEWCATSGTCPGIGDEGLARLRRFREALRGVLEANAGEAQPAERWGALEPFAARAGLKISIPPGGLPVLAPAGDDGPDAAIAAVLAIVYDAIAQGTWPRLKACRKHSCRWAFYDRSKNGSGAWCSMQVCGNRVKAARRRAREKSHEKPLKK